MIPDWLQTTVAVLAVLSPICSAAYVAGMVRAELKGLRRDVDDAHERIDEHERIHHFALKGVHR